MIDFGSYFGSIYDDVKTNFFEILYSKNIYILVFLSSIFILLSYYLYYVYVIKPKEDNYKANKEYIEDKRKDVDLYFFYTQWCPHSKKAKKVLMDFQKENKKINGKTINYFYVDAEEKEELANDFKVESYPSVYLVVDENKIYYDANVKPNLLNKFLETST